MKNKKFWTSLLAILLVAAMLLGLVIMILPASASALSSSEIEDLIEENRKENEELQDRIDELEDLKWENRGEIKQIVAERNALEEQVGLLSAQIDNLNAQIASYNQLIADKQLEVETAQARLSELNRKHKERIRIMEEEGTLSYWSVLFKANSIIDLLDRLNMIEEIAASDRCRLQEMEEAAQEVAAAEAALHEERALLKIAQDELAVKQAESDKKIARTEELIQQLIAKGEEYDQYLDEAENALSKVEEEAGTLEFELDEAKKKEYLEYLASLEIPGNIKPGSNAGVGVGGTVKTDKNGIKWLVPCDYLRVASGFGMRDHPVYHEPRFHNGVDLAAWCLKHEDGTTDSPIYASRGGVVIISKLSESAGWYVTIDHLDGYRSTYMHMCGKPKVDVGDVVVAGQVLGCIGTTGTSTNDHLHFGIYKDGKSVNPMEYIG